jgi:hypothetical protein
VNAMRGSSHSVKLEELEPISKLHPGCPGAAVAQCLAMDWTTRRWGLDPRQRRKDFSSNLCVQTGSGAHPASCSMGTGGPFPGGKSRPGRDAVHSPHLMPMS